MYRQADKAEEAQKIMCECFIKGLSAYPSVFCTPLLNIMADLGNTFALTVSQFFFGQLFEAIDTTVSFSSDRLREPLPTLLRFEQMC
jgi:hypothetical protein